MSIVEINRKKTFIKSLNVKHVMAKGQLSKLNHRLTNFNNYVRKYLS